MIPIIYIYIISNLYSLNQHLKHVVHAMNYYVAQPITFFGDATCPKHARFVFLIFYVIIGL